MTEQEELAKLRLFYRRVSILTMEHRQFPNMAAWVSHSDLDDALVEVNKEWPAKIKGTYMDPQVKTEWLYALRSGDYTQGEILLNRDGKFDVWGVLTDLYISANPTKAKWRLWDAKNMEHMGQTGVAYGVEFTPPQLSFPVAYCHPDILDWAGIPVQYQIETPDGKFAVGQALGMLNDGRNAKFEPTTKFTFAQLADLIEEKL